MQYIFRHPGRKRRIKFTGTKDIRYFSFSADTLYGMQTVPSGYKSVRELSTALTAEDLWLSKCHVSAKNLISSASTNFNCSNEVLCQMLGIPRFLLSWTFLTQYVKIFDAPKVVNYLAFVLKWSAENKCSDRSLLQIILYGIVFLIVHWLWPLHKKRPFTVQ